MVDPDAAGADAVHHLLVGDGQVEGRRDGVGFDDLVAVAGSVVVGMVVVSVAAVGRLSFR